MYFTNDPGIFFPVDQRALSAVNFVNGRVSRLDGAQGTLPYLGHGVEVRHVVGSDAGGGYEWTAKGLCRAA